MAPTAAGAGRAHQLPGSHPAAGAAQLAQAARTGRVCLSPRPEAPQPLGRPCQWLATVAAEKNIFLPSDGIARLGFFIKSVPIASRAGGHRRAEPGSLTLTPCRQAAGLRLGQAWVAGQPPSSGDGFVPIPALHAACSAPSSKR